MTVTIKLEDISLEITGSYDPGYPSLYAYRNGDPGYPEEPPSFDIESVHYNGKDVTQLIDSMNDIFYSLVRKADGIIYESLWIYLENKVIKELNNN